MAIHFSIEEMARRRELLLTALAAEKRDAALMSARESDSSLTGYDNFGFCFFQRLYVGLDGRPVLEPNGLSAPGSSAQR